MEDHRCRRLLTRKDVVTVLQLEEPQVEWLINTSQIRRILICGEERFDSKDIDQFIDSYKITQGRKRACSTTL